MTPPAAQGEAVYGKSTLNAVDLELDARRKL